MKLSDAERFFMVNELPRQLKVFGKHQLQHTGDTPAVQSWSCQSPSATTYRFDVVSMPSRLLISGDIGDLLLKGFSGWGHDWLCNLSVEYEIDYFANKVATWPAELLRPELLLPWLGWHVAAASTFRRLRRIPA